MDRITQKIDHYTMALPFISLVVVNFNGEDIIEKCISSLVKVNYPKNRYEIIVVDNSSTDKSLSIIKKFLKVKLIQNKENIGYVGVNSCLKIVKGKYLFILNNDLEMERDCLKNAVEVIEKDDKIGVVAPKFINYFNRKLKSSGTWISRAFYNGHYYDPKEKERIKETPYLGIELVRTSIVKKFGYIYDPDYFIYAEDLDLSLRFRLLGYKTIFVPSAIIYHMHAITTKKDKSYKMTFLLEKNLLSTFFKVLSWKTIILLSPYVFIMRLVAITRDLVALRFMNLFARIRAILYIIINCNNILKKRSSIQKLRAVDDKYLMRIFTEKYLFRKSIII